MNKINKKTVTNGANSTPGVVPILYSARLRGELKEFSKVDEANKANWIRKNIIDC